MFSVALLGPVPSVGPDPQTQALPDRTGSRAKALLMVSLVITVSVVCGWLNHGEIRRDRQRSNSCILLDEVPNIDTQRNVDCFER